MNLKFGVIDENIEINLIKTMSRLDNDTLFFNEHRLRPPVGIFNISSVRFLDSIESLISELAGLKDRSKIQLLHKEVVEAFMAFIEDSYAIFLCFYKTEEVDKSKKFLHEQLKKTNPDTIKRFYEEIKPLRNLYSEINNAIKHEHSRYITLNMESTYGNCLGYFIDSVDETGTITPNNKIHPLYKGDFTAISYNYDIKRIFIYWLKICELIDYEIKQICIENSITLREDSTTQIDNSRILALLRKVMKLKEYYFFDEYNNDLAKFEITSTEVEIQFPASKTYFKKLFIPKNRKISMTTKGDGITKSWNLPYLNCVKS